MSTNTPVRYPQGMTNHFKWQLLAQYPYRNPFMAHEWEDDFDSVQASAPYTKTMTGNGSIAPTAGDGGLLLFTTNSSTPIATDLCSLQLAVASFQPSLGKRMWYATRLQTNDATNVGIVAGLIQTTTTPFTVTDGLYFSKAPGATVIQLIHTVGSSNSVALTLPANSYTLANNTFIDLGFYLDDKGYLNAFVGSSLFAFMPQSGVGSSVPPRGVVASGQVPTLTAVNLNATLAVRSGTTASKTMTADFILAAKERG